MGKIDFTKGHPSMYSVDHNAPVKSGVTIEEGHAISLDANGEWILGVAPGVLPYVTNHAQSSDALDVARLPGEMGSGGLGGVLCNQVEFNTTQVGALAANVWVSAPAGLFKTAALGEQIIGYCLAVNVDMGEGDVGATIVGVASPSLGT